MQIKPTLISCNIIEDIHCVHLQHITMYTKTEVETYLDSGISTWAIDVLIFLNV